MKISLGEIIVKDIVTRIRESRVRLHHKCYSKLLGGRRYEVCNLSRTNLHNRLLKTIYHYLNIYLLNYNYMVRLNRNNIEIINYNNKGDIWYSLGLAIADASVISKNSVLFSVTQSCLVDAFLSEFPRFYLSIPRYFVSLRTGKISPVFNVIVTWPDLAIYLWKVKKEKNISMIFNNLNNKERFLAGIIDGDGLPDKDNLRIATSKDDVLFDIVAKLFEGAISFDNKRFIIRIKTRKLREIVNLELLVGSIYCESKRSKIEKLAKKRERYDIDLDVDVIREKITRDVLNILRKHDILFRFKVRYHRGYKYLYVTYNRFNKDEILNELESFTMSIKRIFGIDIAGSLKLGKREIVIYNQKIVNFILYLRKLL